MRVLGRILPSLPTMGFPSCCRDLLPRRFIPQPCATFTEEEPSARGQPTSCKYISAWVRPVQSPWSLYARTVMDAAFWHKIVQIKKNSRYFFSGLQPVILEASGNGGWVFKWWRSYTSMWWPGRAGMLPSPALLRLVSHSWKLQVLEKRLLWPVHEQEEITEKLCYQCKKILP